MTSREISSPASAVMPNFDEVRDKLDNFAFLVELARPRIIDELCMFESDDFFHPKLPPMVGAPEKEKEK